MKENKLEVYGYTGTNTDTHCTAINIVSAISPYHLRIGVKNKPNEGLESSLDLDEKDWQSQRLRLTYNIQSDKRKLEIDDTYNTIKTPFFSPSIKTYTNSPLRFRSNINKNLIDTNKIEHHRKVFLVNTVVVPYYWYIKLEFSLWPSSHA